MIDIRQTIQYANYMSSIGWMVEREKDVNYFIKKIPIIGHFMKIQRPEIIDQKTIDSLNKKYRPFQIVVEPKNEKQEYILKNWGFSQSKSYFAPTKTIYIDLRKTHSCLLKQMHPKTRYNIKKKSKQLHTWVSTDVEQFASFWQKCALTQRKMFLSQEKEIINLYKAFKKNAQIAVVSDNSEKDWLSAVLTISSEKTTYYMFAASTLLGKKSFAPTINVWQCIKLAKKAKDKIFDFGGIYDERFPLKSWLGFTRFKKSFGGTIVKYPGAFYKSKLPFISI